MSNKDNSGGKQRDDDLLAFLDGELAPREARAVEERLSGSKDEQLKVEAMQQLGGVLRGYYQAKTAEAAPQLDALWGKLEGQLGTPERAPAAVRSPRPIDRAAAQGGLWAAFRDWFTEGTRGYVLTGAVCAAAAAIIAVYATRQAPKIVERVVTVDRPVPAPQPPEVMAHASKPEVESLEVAGGTGMVAQIPGDANGEGASTVIWVVRDGSGTTAPEGPI